DADDQHAVAPTPFGPTESVLVALEGEPLVRADGHRIAVGQGVLELPVGLDQGDGRDLVLPSLALDGLRDASGSPAFCPLAVIRPDEVAVDGPDGADGLRRPGPDGAIGERASLAADVDSGHPIDGLGRGLVEDLILVPEGDLHGFEQVDAVCEAV